MSSFPPRVLIIGAGLGGLAFAQALRKQQVSFQIFERDSSATARKQGWAINIHWMLDDLLKSTLRDLGPLETCNVTHELGIPTEFAFFDAFSGDTVRRVCGRTPDGKDIAIRVNRARYRDWLSQYLDIQWNKVFSYFEEIEDGVKVYFTDGTFAIGEMLVGADGIQSPVRAQLLGPDPPRLNIVPVGIITGELQLSREEYERQIAIAPSYYILYGYGARFFVGLRNVSEDKSTAQYYWMATWDDYLSSDPAKFWTSKASKQDLLDFALELTKNFHLRFMEIFSLTRPEDIMTPVIIVRDLEPRAMPSGRVTLLGDAVHPMTFFRGEGANHAMQDGLSLAKRISEAIALSEGIRVGAKLDIPGLLKSYEEEMQERGKKAVLESREAAENSSKMGTDGIYERRNVAHAMNYMK